MLLNAACCGVNTPYIRGNPKVFSEEALGQSVSLCVPWE